MSKCSNNYIRRLSRAMPGLWLSITIMAGFTATPVLALEIKLGLPSVAGDVAIFIAHKRGYFKEEGLEVELVKMASGARMIAPLSTGEMHVAAVAVSAGLFNAIARGIDIRIVSDKGRTYPGRGTQAMLVRRSLYESGEIRSLKDLKGRKVALAAPGSAAGNVFLKLLEKGGLTMNDVQVVYLSFPQHFAALANGAIDAALTAQPTTNTAIAKGIATAIAQDTDAIPVHQIAVMLYSGAFIKQHSQAARGFMRAYLRGVRDQNDALAPDGNYTGEKGDAVVKILAEYGPFKTPEIYRSFVLNNMDPNGEMNVESIQQDFEIMKKSGLVKGDLDVRKMIDTSFLDWAVKQMGRYAKK